MSWNTNGLRSTHKNGYFLPLFKKYQPDTNVHEYLKVHGQDEVKHFQWLTQYVKENTQYVRKGKSLSDQIFYEGLLPRIGAYAEEKPVYLFCLMYFYELFTLDFYKELIRAANEDHGSAAVL